MEEHLTKVNVKWTRVVYLLDFPQEYLDQICPNCHFFACIDSNSARNILQNYLPPSKNNEKTNKIYSDLKENKFGCNQLNCPSNWPKFGDQIDDKEQSKFKVLCKYYKNGCKKITTLKLIFAHQKTCIHCKNGLNYLRFMKFCRKRNKARLQVEIQLNIRKCLRILSKYAFFCSKYIQRAIFFTLELREHEPELNSKMLIPLAQKILIIRFSSLELKLQFQEKDFWDKLVNIHTLEFNWCYSIPLNFWKQLENFNGLIKGLKNLIFHSCSFLSIDFSNFLQTIKSKECNLTSISFQGAGSSIDDFEKDLWYYFKYVPTLEIIKFYFSSINFDNFCLTLTTLPNLKKIEIKNCKIPEIESVISDIFCFKSKNFESFQLVGNNSSSEKNLHILIIFLSNAPNLKVIELSNIRCSLGSFSEILVSNNIIEEIYLQNHTWNDKQVELFAQKLKICKLLKILDLSINSDQYLKIPFPNSYYVNQITDSLVYTNSIEKLIIENCMINESIIQCIFLIILKCQNIQSIQMNQFKQNPIVYPDHFFDTLNEFLKERKLDSMKFSFKDYNTKKK